MIEFSKKTFVVDKLHIQGHVDEWCRINCDPIWYPQILAANTVVCEQINYWIGKYKYIMKHMNSDRYNFYMYILFNEYNKLKVNGKYYTVQKQIPAQYPKKRCYSEIE